jgi:hypothetical protein
MAVAVRPEGSRDKPRHRVVQKASAKLGCRLWVPWRFLLDALAQKLELEI